MKLFNKLVVATAMSIACVSAMAEGVSYGSALVIQFWANHPGALVKIDSMSDPDKCGRNDFYILPDSHDHRKEIYALLLAANVSGQKVQLWTSGCEWNFPKIVNAMILK
jgi:hypothetical protein